MTKEFPQSPVVYKDIRLFLLLIPFINVLNYYLTYTNIPFSWWTALTFTIDTLQGYAAWWLIRSIILYFDIRLPYEPNPLKRILIQLFVTSLAGLSVIIITTEIINAIARDTPVPVSFYKFDIFIFLIWFLVVNGIYIAWHYYLLWNASEKLRTEEKKVRQDGFMVKQGKQNQNIPMTEIAGFYIEGEYAILLTTNYKKHLLDQSLDKVEKQLPAEFFFRLSRQYILHRKMIRGFETGENGKINILVIATESLPAIIQVSRLKAVAFKRWFKPGM